MNSHCCKSITRKVCATWADMVSGICLETLAIKIIYLMLFKVYTVMMTLRFDVLRPSGQPLISIILVL